MSTLSVWRFDTPDGAENAVSTLGELSQQKLIAVHAAATVSWQPGARKPKTRQLQDLTGAGALGGAFWGLLFGLLFLVPLLGAAIGAAAGALTGRLTDVGIDDTFIKRAGADHPGHLGAVRADLRRRSRPGPGGVRRTARRAAVHEPDQGAGGRPA